LRTISKSRFLVAKYCSRRLWLESNLPKERQESSGMAIVSGNRVGELARQQRPGGVMVGHPDDFGRALQETQEILARPGDLTIFEPVFSVDGGAVRCDILERRQGRYYLTEVKSSTEIKEHHSNDLAFQAWVLGKAGLNVAGAQMQLVNRTFVYQGDGNYSGIFRTVDLTKNVRELEGKLERMLRDCQAVVEGPEPRMARGGHCQKPWECGFQRRCSEGEPEYPVSVLGVRGKSFLNLAATNGWKDIRDVPEEHVEGELAARIWRATRSGKGELNGLAAKEIAALPFPRLYFDFETFGSAIPKWKGTSPYQHVPFQWSCHIQGADGGVEHMEFLDTTGEFPGYRLSEAMIEALGNTGPIFVYTGFEKGAINTLVELCPELRAPLEGIVARLVDLHPLTKASYYHPHMRGSWSIKAVLPTVAPELSYSNLGEVQEGGEAIAAYEEIVDPRTESGRRQQLVEDILRYCKRDTEAMVALVNLLSSG